MKISSLTDAELMKRVGMGAEDAFEELVWRHQAFAWNIAARVIGDADAAQDVVQEAFLRLFRAASRYEPTATFRTYFSRIVIRLCWQHAKKKKPVFFASPPEQGDSSSPPSDEALQKERTAALQAALNNLPASQRTALVLVYFEHMSYRQTAAAMEKTEKAVEGLLSRALETLRKHLADWQPRG